MGMFTEWRDDEIAKLQQQLQEARAEIERLALEIENQQYTITCASEENQQVKESLAEARAEIERKDKLIGQMRDALKALKQRHYVNDDDNWYSCPASGLCSKDSAGTDCDCGADHVNHIIDAALSAAERINK